MGARILRRRKEKGLTQEALANQLGVSNQAEIGRAHRLNSSH